jgi:hypothetical protein
VLKFILRAACWLGLCLVPGAHLAGDTLRLSITNDPSGLLLSWPAWASDAVLEQSPALEPAPSWSALSPALYQSDGVAFSHRLSALEGSRFFRVRRLGPPVPGLTGYWQLDEGTGAVASDLTGSGMGLYLTNTAWAGGRFGPGSLGFNGQDPSTGGSLAWVSNTNYRVLPPGGRPFSVSLWFSPSVLTVGSRQILGNDGNGSNGWHVALDTAGVGTNYLILTGTGNGTSLSVTGRTLLLPGQWYQLMVACESNQAKLYLDSGLLAQQAATLINESGPLYFGAVPGIFGSFLGRIDEIRTYTNALSAEQISLAGEWHFDENTGFFAADGNVEGHLGSVTVPTAWAPGKSGAAIDLALGSVVIANDDYGVLPASGGAFGVSAWVRPRALPVGRSGLFSCADAANRGWQLTIEVENSGQAWLEFTSTNLNGTLGLRTPCALTNGAWTKLDLNYNGGIAGIYVNGCKVGSESGAIQGARAPLVVGVVAGAANFNGLIDELKIYRRERADTEIGPVALPLWEMAWVNSSTNLVLPGSGPPGKTITYSLLSAPNQTRGTLTLSPGSPIVTYQAGGQKGPDLFAYTVSDGEFTSPPATGVVSVVAPHWLSPTGGVQEPLDGSSPQRAWAASAATALDAIWHTNNYFDCFFYAPGEYQTTGWKFNQRSTANPGCKHMGSGSEGSAASVIKLVETWSAWEEGVIFSPLHQTAYCDCFEVRNLVLDCNAQNNPKYAVGEPVWLRIPLTTTARVDSVTLHWTDAPIAGNSAWKSGRAAEFSLCTGTFRTNVYVTNCLSFVSTGLTDVVTVGTDTDELLVQLTQRGSGVDFYGLGEVEVSGASVSLPVATSSEGGESRLDAQHSIFQAVDQNPATSWASGPESQVQIMLPLRVGTAVSQIQLQWNCQTLTNLHRLGPAAQYLVFARDQSTGQLVSVPFVTGGRSAAGLETATFGTAQANNSVVTDQLVILLTTREAGVDYYSLREVTLQNRSVPVPMLLPTAMNSLDTTYSLLSAFDGDTRTAWVSGTQGSVSAIDLVGSNLKFIGLKVIGFGTKAVRECFPLIAFVPIPATPALTPVGNVLVEDCLITQPATNNSDGLSAVVIGGAGTASPYYSAIRRCAVTGVGGHFSYSHAFGAHLIENSFVDDCQVGVYFEPNPSSPDSTGAVIIRSNLFQNVVRAISADFIPNGRLDSVVCLGNEMVLAGTAFRGWGVGACDACSPGPTGAITNVTILNNIIRYPDWASRPGAPEEGLVYGDIHHAVYGNNLIALGTANALRVRQDPVGSIPAPTIPEDCDHPGLVLPGPSSSAPSLNVLRPGYRRAWFNNRDASGLLLPVRYRFWGVDGLAWQQQWPE